jgi:hypothetical protein
MHMPQGTTLVTTGRLRSPAVRTIRTAPRSGRTTRPWASGKPRRPASPPPRLPFGTAQPAIPARGSFSTGRRRIRIPLRSRACLHHPS